jgi:Uma2 family endonuclease
MTGSTARQSTIQVNLLGKLRAQLCGKPCRAHGSHMKIFVADSIRYPDAFVVCSPVEGQATVIEESVVVFELLSPSTAFVDRGAKSKECRDTPSIQRHVMLEQDRQAATVFTRAADDWVGLILSGNAVLDMPEIGISIPLADLYEGVTFDDAA